MRDESVVEGYRLSPQQRRLWLSRVAGTALRAQCALRLTGELDLRSLEEAVNVLIARHEILRTTYRQLPPLKTPVQVVNDDNHPPSWRHVSLRGLHPHARRARIEELYREDAERPFDFERGPVLRLTLAAAAPHEHLLFISLPALCAD